MIAELRGQPVQVLQSQRVSIISFFHTATKLESWRRKKLKGTQKQEKRMEDSSLSNRFSGLQLDAEDSKVQHPIASASGSNTSHVKKEKQDRKNRETPGEYKLPLVWIDLEMTGLDLEVDRILEIACVITDGYLTQTVEGPDLVIHQTKECLANMGEWCQNHHGDSGLKKEVLESTITEREAEKQVIEFVKKHVDVGSSYKPLLAGNSIYVDYLYLKKYMPELAALFPHVLVDVSSVKALCIRWYPTEHRGAPLKESRHRAMDDIKESIKELRYYKANIFKPKARKR